MAVSAIMHSRFCFLHDPAPTQIYTLSLHDALPISLQLGQEVQAVVRPVIAQGGEDGLQHGHELGSDPGNGAVARFGVLPEIRGRSEEHTSELQSRENLVCRLLLEKKKKQIELYKHF